MAYRVTIEVEAQRQLDRIPNPIRNNIQRRIAALSEQPRPPGVIKLRNDPHGQWRLRIGDWRVLYKINDPDRTVVVTHIRPRGEAYRDF